MNEKQPFYEGTISNKYAIKETIKTWIILTLIFIGTYLFIWLVPLGTVIEDQSPYPVFILTVISFIGLGIYILILIFSYIYYRAYIRNFAYEIHEENVVIFHGVFTKVKATIPYSRVQNINIANGIFDRMFDLYTAKIETAGFSGSSQSAQGGPMKPEGYIPALEDPNIVETKMKEMINKYSSIPSGLEDKVFKPEELAFDNFISYILSKMRPGERLETSIKELREEANMTVSELAEKVEVPVQIYELKYNTAVRDT
ncbi:MAG: PH domain-containing protein [Candidatus Lokiarchaeota archaeon]